MNLGLLALTAAAALAGPLDERPASTGNPPIACEVRYIYDVPVPAEVQGVIREVRVKEGEPVTNGMLLAQIDDRIVKSRKEVALAELSVAKEQAESDIHVRHATESTKAAKAAYEMHKQANAGVPGAVPQLQMDQLRLEWNRAYLSIEQAELDQSVAQRTAEARQVEANAVDTEIDQHQVKASADGVVTEVLVEVGEWVSPGAPVARVVKLDRLRVEGLVPLAQFPPSAIAGRPVKVRVQLEGQRFEEFDGQITFVKPEVQGFEGGKQEYKVWAEVDNRREGADGRWLLWPGLEAQMQIEIAAPPGATAHHGDGPEMR